MKNFSFRKIVFINLLIALMFMLATVNKYEVFADEACTAGQLVDYLAELTNLGVLEDNSFEGKKQGLNKFGIEGLEYLSSPEDKVTVEKLSSVCAALMRCIGEDRAIVIKDDGSNYQVVDKKGKVLYSDGKWLSYGDLCTDEDITLEKEIKERNGIKNYGRINDLDKADNIHKLNLVTTLRKGIIIGKSLGKYSQKRNIEPKRKVSLKDIKKAIDRVYNSDKRYPMSRDGQLIRKTNLPVNASEYKYILAAFPNSFYETRFTYENHDKFFVKIHEFYDKPKAVYEDLVGYFTHNVYDKADRVRKLQDVRMNIDYRKIGKKWRDELVSYYKSDYDENENLEGIKKEIDEYIKFVKKNKIIVEAEPSIIEGSAVYRNNFKPCFHTYMRFRIISCKDLDKNLEKIIYGSMIVNEGWGISRNYKEKVELGKWIEGVYCVAFPEIRPNAFRVPGYPWKWVNECYFDNTTRNLRKKHILKQFRITSKDKLWYYPEMEGILYGWR